MIYVSHALKTHFYISIQLFGIQIVSTQCQNFYNWEVFLTVNNKQRWVPSRWVITSNETLQSVNIVAGSLKVSLVYNWYSVPVANPGFPQTGAPTQIRWPMRNLCLSVTSFWKKYIIFSYFVEYWNEVTCVAAVAGTPISCSLCTLYWGEPGVWAPGRCGTSTSRSRSGPVHPTRPQHVCEAAERAESHAAVGESHCRCKTHYYGIVLPRFFFTSYHVLWIKWKS